jgi:hypothetical protein
MGYTTRSQIAGIQAELTYSYLTRLRSRVNRISVARLPSRRRLESWWKICTQRPQLTFWEEIHPFVKDTTMPSAPLPPEKAAEVQALAEAIRQAVNAEVEELASTLAHTDDQHLFGQNEFKLRDLAHKIAAKALEQRLAQKKTATKGPA